MLYENLNYNIPLYPTPLEELKKKRKEISSISTLCLANESSSSLISLPKIVFKYLKFNLHLIIVCHNDNININCNHNLLIPTLFNKCSVICLAPLVSILHHGLTESLQTCLRLLELIVPFSTVTPFPPEFLEQALDVIPINRCLQINVKKCIHHV